MDDPNPEALCWILQAKDGEAEFLANKSQVFLFLATFRSLDNHHTIVYTYYEGQRRLCGGWRLFLKKVYIFDPDIWRDKFLSGVIRDILLTKFCQKCFYGKYKIDFYFSLRYTVCSISNYYIHTHTL